MNILFPIETIARELDFRLALAAEFLRPGRTVYVGQHDVLHKLVPHLGSGLFVGKSIFPTLVPASPARYEQLRDGGFKIVYLHEEGAIFRGAEDEWHRALDRQFDMRRFDRDDMVCTWGRFQADHCEQRNPAMRGRVFVTGHPRFDLYKQPLNGIYSREAEELRRRYGRFILINSNFAWANPGMGGRDLTSLFRSCAGSPEKIAAARAWSHHNHVLASYIELVFRLAERYPDLSIVFRPHPSEKHSTYSAVFGGLPQVHVVHSGAVGPWLLAAEALVHDGCTTAVEAYFAGKQPIQYRPTSPGEFAYVVPEAVSQCCTTIPEVFERLEQSIGKADAREHQQISSRALGLLHNFESDSMGGLTHVMATAVEELQGRPLRADKPTLPAAIRMYTAETAVRTRIAKMRPSRREQYVYTTTKFPGFREQAVAERLRTLETLTRKPIRMRFISDTLFVLTTADSHAGSARAARAN